MNPVFILYFIKVLILSKNKGYANINAKAKIKSLTEANNVLNIIIVVYLGYSYLDKIIIPE